MVYPGAGIAVSNGSAWITSITDNSTNWNSAYSHISSTANPHSVTATQVSLGNVTNESKATMFTSPTFTGTIPKYSTTDTLALLSNIRALFTDTELGVASTDSSVNKGYAAFYTTTQLLAGKTSPVNVRAIVNDSLNALRTNAVQGERALGNPSTTGYVLSSTTDGVRSWIPPATGGGGGTVTSVGLSVPTGLSISGSPITTSGTLAITLATGRTIPTTTEMANAGTAYGWG